MDKNNLQNKRIKKQCLAYILGLTSILGQVLLLRELISVFYGNETAYAVVLASWLFWIAVGSGTVSLFSSKIKDPKILLAAFFWMISFILPITIFAARCMKPMMQIRLGEIVGILPMCISSFLLLGLLTFLLGAIFALVCKLSNNSARGIGTIYLWESIGALCGGLAFSFVLVHVLPAMHIAFIIGAVNIFAAMMIYGKKSALYEPGKALIFVIVVCLISGLVSRYDDYSRKMQWKGTEVVKIADSIYGNIALVKKEDQYSLYENGLHSFTYGDELSSEQRVHYALLSHPAPKGILLIGGGIAGASKEILKHPGTLVDYIELDSKVIELSKKYLPKGTVDFLNDERLKVILSDARLWIKQTSKKYDAVIVSLPDPYTALINRYYSLEFFKEVDRILKPGGILSLSVSSSENYLNDENREFLRSMNSTLSQVFEEVKSIPGDTNIFIASNKNNFISIDPDVLSLRIKERGLETKYVREYYLPFNLSEDRIDYIDDILETEGQINTDTHPIGYLFDIVLWSTHFNTTFTKIVRNLQKIKFLHLMLVPLMVLIFGWILKRKWPSSPITLSIMTTGFSEIIFQLIIIIAFQALYGYAYYKIGLIIASFMMGLALGSLVARKIITRTRKKIPKVYRISQLGICIYPCILPFLFIVFRDAFVSERFVWFFASAFALLPTIAGFMGGLQYPLATQIVSNDQKTVKNATSMTAGFLYAVDVLGSSIGALLTGMFLIPLFGIDLVAYFCAILNLAVFILIII